MIPSQNHKVRWKKRNNTSQEMALNITSMADIFTIILVFLLKSFSAEGTSLTPGLAMQLPTVKHGLQVSEGLKIEISDNAVQVDGKTAAELKSFEFNPTEITATLVDTGVDQAIAQIRAKHPDQHDALTVMADYKTPYNTLKTVLASAANYGYLNYRLVVVKEEE
jgi:biopolymer transport protein ExbD